MKKIFIAILFVSSATLVFGQLKENVGIGVRLQLDSTRGYKIPLLAGLIPDGAAESSGLKVGDLILKVNDKSTKNLILKDVVAMITGEEGSSVKLEIERKGVMKNYNITRGKYKYSASFYEPAVKDNNFCTALTTLMNDAGYDFANTMDKNVKDKNGNFVSKIKVPGAEITGIYDGLGSFAEITVGSYTGRDEVNTVGTKFVEQLKICFPEYYYEPEVDRNGSVSVNIGRNFKSGFESPVLQLLTFFDKVQQKHKLQLRVLGGKLTIFNSINARAENNSFANSLRTLYNDINNDFRKVKGTKHENPGGIFSGSVWYEIKPVPDGAKSCSVTEGGMSLGSKNCTCGFYQGSSRTDAVNAYNAVFNKMTTALGSEFVYTTDKSPWDMNIPPNAEAAVSFGIKSKKTYESNVPIIVLLFEKYENSTYGVRMLFYKQGF